MKHYTLEKGYIYKLFMFLVLGLFALVMYQGHIKGTGIYSILFYGALILCAFQVVSLLYVLVVKRVVEVNIDENLISWRFFDNKKLTKEQSVKRDDIKEVKTEVNYLTGNIYSNFSATFILRDDTQVVLSDGLIYDFGLKKAEDLCRLLLDNDLGNKQDIKFAKLVKELELNINKEQIFTKKDGKSYYVGVISKHKKEFLSLRLQIEKLYEDYKIIEKNANNEYLVKSDTLKDSSIYLRSNAIGYFIEFVNVSRKEELKTLKQLGQRQKIGF